MFAMLRMHWSSIRSPSRRSVQPKSSEAFMAQVLEEKRVETKAWPWVTFGLACAVASAACVWIPIHIIRPFHPQDAAALTVALRVHDAGPWLAGLCAALVVVLTIWSWKRVSGRAP